MQTAGGLPADIENQFLRNIMEYEKQAAERKMMKVFDKIERPSHFKPVNEIPDDEIENAWHNLDEYLKKYGIDLSICSPNISDRELYRFTTEELFNHEMNATNVPGWWVVSLTMNFTRIINMITQGMLLMIALKWYSQTPNRMDVSSEK